MVKYFLQLSFDPVEFECVSRNNFFRFMNVTRTYDNITFSILDCSNIVVCFFYKKQCIGYILSDYYENADIFDFIEDLEEIRR